MTVQMSLEEREVLNAAAKEAGKNRNAFIRDWIATLTPSK